MKKGNKVLDEREKYLLVADERESPEQEVQSDEESEQEEKISGQAYEEAESAEALDDGAEDEKIKEDIKQFRELFPRVSESEIPDEVWERVGSGESLAASYALYFIKCVRDDGKSKKASGETAKKAPPKLKGGNSAKAYFSPEAVRNMSAAEVRKNYDAIIASMASWNR